MPFGLKSPTLHWLLDMATTYTADCEDNAHFHRPQAFSEE